MFNLDAYEGKAEDATFDLKREPIETDDLVKQIQAGLNGNSRFTIIIGAEEVAGKFRKENVQPITWPIRIRKTAFENLDKYRLHVHQTLESNTEGYRSGHVEILEVPVAGGFIIAVEVMPLPGGPYQNLKDKRFYGRDGPRTRPLTGSEIRDGIAVSDPRIDRRWPNPGDQLIAPGARHEFKRGVFVADAKSLVRLRLFCPVAASAPLAASQMRERLNDFYGLIAHGYSSGDFERNKHGYAAWWYWNVPRGSRGLAGSVTQAFGDGEIQGIDIRLLSSGEVPLPAIEDNLPRALEAYRRYLLALGFSPPFKWAASLEGVENAFVLVPGGRIGPIFEDEIETRGDDDCSDDAAEVLGPFFQDIVRAAGYER